MPVHSCCFAHKPILFFTFSVVFVVIVPLKIQNKTLFIWSRGPRSSGVRFFCFLSFRAWKQKKRTPLDRGPPLHVNRPYFLVCNHVTRRPCWMCVSGQCNRIFPRRIYMKIGYGSQRREMLLFWPPTHHQHGRRDVTCKAAIVYEIPDIFPGCRHQRI